ncbi:hypothetical protein IM697_24020 [Streptomyces ferrugineus]|uniref:Uncharacterized protein n=1 Tax=Streptomyces ferrugineus TaxID=1413221 RepID=A0A7M2SDR5_9ACTN|nr:hypothetical protein IM697_24020 [Streptomyces ferrugineus]
MATVSAQVPPPGGVLAVEPGEASPWRGPLPVHAPQGIRPRQAALLTDCGITCVGVLAAIPPATVQRLLAGRAVRRLGPRYRPMPRRLPRPARLRERPPRLARHPLDGTAARAALLDLSPASGNCSAAATRRPAP